MSSSSLAQRTFNAEEWVRFTDDKATVTEISVTARASVAVWGVKPGQQVQPHFHPDGQDTWVMIRGTLTYYLGNGQKKTISAGDIDIAEETQVHGAINEGVEDVIFLSIYSAPSLKVIKAAP